MRPREGRALLLDVPLACAVTALSLAAAQLAHLVGRFDGGPWQRGGEWPMGGSSAQFVPTSVSWPLYPCLVLLGVGLALRRVTPRAGFVAVVVGVAGYLAAGGPSGPVLLAPALSLLALALALPTATWAPMTLLLVPMLAARTWDQPYGGLLEPSFYGALVSGITLMLVPAMLGLIWRSRREADRTQREQELHRYAYEERLQIARDVHDVVGHSLSVINLQAGVALHVLDRRPDEVQTSLEAIRRTSREALAELRTTLAVYRQPPGADRAPQPGLARLGDLVGALRAAGREVIVRSEGRDRRCSAGGGRPGGVPDRPGGADQRGPARPRRSGDSADLSDAGGSGGGSRQRGGPGRPDRRGRRHRRHEGARTGGRRWPRGHLRPRLVGAGRAAAGAGRAGRMTISVAIADDQPLVRMGLRVLVESEDDLRLAGEAEDGRRALELVRAVRPDVVLMDVRMPGLDGIGALREISRDPDLAGTRVVILTTFELDEYVFDALQAGAAGFLIKDSEPADMLRAIRLAAAGESLLSPSVTRRVIESFRARPRTSHRPHPRLSDLTDREREVLGLIGEGLSNDDIATRLVVSPATARTHVSRAMIKLGARDRAQLVVIAYQAGLVS